MMPLRFGSKAGGLEKCHQSFLIQWHRLLLLEFRMVSRAVLSTPLIPVPGFFSLPLYGLSITDEKRDVKRFSVILVKKFPNFTYFCR